MQTAPAQEAAPGREACGGGGSTELGRKGRVPKRSSKRLLETRNPALHPESRRGVRSEGLSQVGFAEGIGCSPRGEPGARQIPSSIWENHQHSLPQNTKPRRLAGQSSRGIQITKKSNSVPKDSRRQAIENSRSGTNSLENPSWKRNCVRQGVARVTVTLQGVIVGVW